MKKELTPPVKKGDIITLGVRSIGKDGDLLFKQQKYCLFLKNFKGKPVTLNQMIKLKVVKIFEKLGYVELYE